MMAAIMLIKELGSRRIVLIILVVMVGFSTICIADSGNRSENEVWKLMKELTPYILLAIMLGVFLVKGTFAVDTKLANQSSEFQRCLNESEDRAEAKIQANMLKINTLEANYQNLISILNRIDKKLDSKNQ